MPRDRVTLVAVVVVALVAAIVSYAHMQLVADHAGEKWRSWLIPISVDGLIVAASMVLLTSRRQYFAWAALVTGVVASLAANMAAARPEVVAVLVAGWAPVAFAASFHLLLQQRRLTSTTTATPAPAAQPEQATAPATSPASWSLPQPASPAAQLHQPEPVVATQAPVQPTNHPTPAPAVQLAARVVAPAPSRQPRPRPEVKESGSGSRREVTVDDARKLVRDGLGRAAIAERLGVSAHTARRLIDQVHAEDQLRLVRSP